MLHTLALALALAITAPISATNTMRPVLARATDQARLIGAASATTIEKAPDPARPQTPLPPFPYSQREITVKTADNATLAGTLTIPEEQAFGKGPFPAAILITGSGPQDRDETLFNHKPFAVIADHLTRRGLCVIRLDDRGVAGSKAAAKPDATTLTFVADIQSAVDFAKTQPEIDATKLGLIGHSEGGLIAPIVASQRPDDVHWIILLAGTGVNGTEILKEQMVATARTTGSTEAQVAALIPEINETFKIYNDENTTSKQRDAVMRRLVARQLKLDPDADLTPQQTTMIQAGIAQGNAQFGNPWMKTFLTLDPAPYLAKTKCPVLALNGSKDQQVLPWQNLPTITAALTKAGNPDVTAIALPNLNHLFQTATTGAFAEYAMIKETFAPTALDAMTAWLTPRVGLKK